MSGVSDAVGDSSVRPTLAYTASEWSETPSVSGLPRPQNLGEQAAISVQRLRVLGKGEFGVVWEGVC